jgi:3D (Asp-Asp-Asp) domain-containing protein
MITNLVITAYCACKLCCGPHASGLAANGHHPVEGITVAASRSIPLGTKVHIEGVGDRVVQDRLARRFDDRIDVYFTSHEAAKRFGKRRLKVTIYRKPAS